MTVRPSPHLCLVLCHCLLHVCRQQLLLLSRRHLTKMLLHLRWHERYHLSI